MTPSLNPFAAAFDSLRPRLLRIAYRMLGSSADAEDVLQEAFLRRLDADATRCSNRKRSCAAS